MDRQTNLREHAESILSANDDFDFSVNDVWTLARELAVHQIELEVQNEELRKAQITIADARDRYQDLYDFSPAAYLTLDKGGRIVQANVTASQMFGVERNSLQTMHFTQLCSMAKGDLSFAPPIPSEEDEMTEILFQTANGKEFWGQVNARNSYGKENGEPQVRLTILDVTDSIEAERKIRDLAKFPEEDNSPVLRMGTNGDLLYANEAANVFLEMMRLQYGESPIPHLLTKFSDSIARWEPCNQIVQCKDCWFLLAITPVAGEDYVNVYGQDITTQRELEKQVHQKLKMEVIGLLSGGIAHDFNNILGAIMGFASLAEDEVPQESTLEYYIANILKASERAKDLVNKILLFSRHAHDTKRVISLVPVVEEVHRFLQASLPVSIDVRCNVEATPLVYADATRIHEVLMNLCSNAAYAMDEKGVIEISCRERVVREESSISGRTLKPGTYLAISIKDSGCGMTEDILPHVVEPFFTTKAAELGSGMGMAIVNSIIQNHAGYMDIQSQPNVGTTVLILLPATTEKPTVPEEALTEIPRGTARILFVDDETSIIDFAKITLVQLGYTVSSFSDSLQALAVFKDDPDAYDLVITDQTMPELSGMELAQEILRLRPDIPIILCTGFSKVVDEKIAIAAGIRGFCFKPLKRGEFARKVRDVLEDG